MNIFQRILLRFSGAETQFNIGLAGSGGGYLFNDELMRTAYEPFLQAFPSLKFETPSVPSMKEAQLLHMLNVAPNATETAFTFWQRVISRIFDYGYVAIYFDKDTPQMKILEGVTEDDLPSNTFSIARYVDCDGRGVSACSVFSEKVNRMRKIIDYEFARYETLPAGVLSKTGLMTKVDKNELLEQFKDMEDKRIWMLGSEYKYTQIFQAADVEAFTKNYTINLALIASCLGVPSEMIIGNTPKPSRDIHVQFAKRGLQPMIACILQKINKYVAETTFEMKAEKFYRSTVVELSQPLSTAVNGGLMSINEARAHMGLPPSAEEGADKLKQNAGMITVNQTSDKESNA